MRSVAIRTCALSTPVLPDTSSTSPRNPKRRAYSSADRSSSCPPGFSEFATPRSISITCSEVGCSVRGHSGRAKQAARVTSIAGKPEAQRNLFEGIDSLLFVLTIDVTGFLQTLAERGHVRRVSLWRCAVEESDHRQRWLLRPRFERPRDGTAEQCDELAPFQSTKLHSRPLARVAA